MGSLGPLDFLDPRVFDHTKDEIPRFVLHGFICSLIADPNLVDCPFPGTDWCLLVVLNGHIVNFGIPWTAERGGVICCVCCRVLYNPDEVVYTVLLVVRDDEEDFKKNLKEFCKVWVRGLDRNGLGFLERFEKCGGYVVDQHSVIEDVAAVGCWNSSRWCCISKLWKIALVVGNAYLKYINDH